MKTEVRRCRDDLVRLSHIRSERLLKFGLSVTIIQLTRHGTATILRNSSFTSPDDPITR